MTKTDEKSQSMSAVELLKRLDIAEIDARIADLDNELDALRSLRKALDIRINGRKPKAPRCEGKSAKGAAIMLGKRRSIIAKYLEAMGPKKPALIAAENSLTTDEVIAALNSDSQRFHMEPDGRWCVNGQL